MNTSKYRKDRCPKLTKDFLLENYEGKRKSIKDISQETGYAKITIARRLTLHGITHRTALPTMTDLTGQKIGEWEVLSKEKTVRGRIYYKCRCSCGAEKSVRHTHMISGKSSKCIRCAHPGAYKHSRWKGHGEISGRKWRDIIRNATMSGTRVLRNKKFSISIEFAWKLFLKQDRKCALSGIPIRFQEGYKDKIQTTASLDRIDSNGSYTEENVQWLHKHVNRMKNNFEEKYFLDLCKKIYHSSLDKR